jgi:hypothetical protein
MIYSSSKLVLHVALMSLGWGIVSSSGARTRSSEPHVLVLISARTIDCSCQATVHNCGNNAGSPPTIFVTTPSKADSTCEPHSPQCNPIQGNNCKATVKAELQWPSNPCFSSGSVTGPGIGSDDSPCQATAAPNNVAVTWNLVAACVQRASQREARIRGHHLSKSGLRRVPAAASRQQERRRWNTNRGWTVRPAIPEPSANEANPQTCHAHCPGCRISGDGCVALVRPARRRRANSNAAIKWPKVRPEHRCDAGEGADRRQASA